MDSSQTPVPPSTVSIIALVASMIFAAVSRLTTAPIRWFRWDGAPLLFKDVFYAAIRAMLSKLTIAQARYIYKDTTQTYDAHCKESGDAPQSVDIETHNVKAPNFKAHWIGDPDADIHILYLHGGGYTQPCTPEHMRYFRRLVKGINAYASVSQKQSIAVLLPAYTLAPEAIFPAQLQQAAAALAFLLSRRSPSNVMITGDSAGGGLTLSLLSHLLHPHPLVEQQPLSTPLKGVFMFSPFVSFDTTSGSYTRNRNKDALVANVLRKWSSMYLGTTEGERDPGYTSGGDAYSEPLLANPSWWQGMHYVTQHVLIWGGQDELFIDGLREFAAKFKQGWKTGGGDEQCVETQFAKDCAHIGPIMDVMLQYKEKGEAALAVEDWLERQLA